MIDTDVVLVGLVEVGDVEKGTTQIVDPVQRSTGEQRAVLRSRVTDVLGQSAGEREGVEQKSCRRAREGIGDGINDLGRAFFDVPDLSETTSTRWYSSAVKN